MGKVKEYYQKQIDNDDYYFEPEVEYHTIYQYIGKWTPTIENWYNKKYANPKDYKPKWCQYIKAEKVECPF